MHTLEAAWSFGDFVFNTDFDVVSDLTKLHQYGGHEILRTLNRLQTARLFTPLMSKVTVTVRFASHTRSGTRRSDIGRSLETAAAGPQAACGTDQNALLITPPSTRTAAPVVAEANGLAR